MTNVVGQVYFSNRKSLHDWLAKNHNTVKSIWLVHDKFSSPESKLSYEDIVEEALCWGWIDSTVKKIDDKRSMIYLSTRKPKSIWARSNKDRVERLVKAGLMQPPGLKSVKIAKENGSWRMFDVVEDLVFPSELKEAFQSNRTAAENFEKYSTSLKKQILYHIYSAKQAETRQKRVDKLLESFKLGKNPFV